MKIKIDEMLEELYPNEILSIDECLLEDQQKRIEGMILSGIRQCPKEEESGVQEEPRKREASMVRKRNPRRLFTFLLVAVLAAAMTMIASAAEKNDWDLAIMEFMGLEDSDTIQWSDGSVEIGVSDQCSGTDYGSDPKGIRLPLTITAASSIGDQNAAYIRFDTDYELPEDFDSERDYILPGTMDLGVYRKDPQKDPSVTNYGSVFTCGAENGKLIFMLYVADCPQINKSYLNLHFEDLYLYHDRGVAEDGETDASSGSADGEPELLYKGSWSLNWKYAYCSNVRKTYLFRCVELDQVRCYITHMEVSPLGVRLEGFVNPLHRVKSAVRMDLEKITYQNGEVLTVNDSSVAGCRNGIWLESYSGIDVIGEVLNVDQVKSITINGCELDF
ncbi:MAG: hypothetical protein MR332_11805 [Fusicatenibacter sp.]|nr:hypothetical protein [Fusicatenibacter sp.]